MSDLITKEILPLASQYKYQKFFLIPPSNILGKEINRILKNFTPQKKKMYHLLLNPENFELLKSWKDRIPRGYHMEKITSELLENKNLENINEIEYCIKACWRQIDQYLEQGIGYCLFSPTSIVSWCSTDFIVRDKCELYVETFQNYRKNGYASLVTSKCIGECLKRNLDIYWHCWEYNIGSVKLAKKMGFEKESETLVYYIDL